MSNSKPGRDGQRPGSGQPALGGAAVGESKNLVVRLAPDQHQRIDQLAEQSGSNRSDAARAALDAGLAQLLK